MESLHVAISAYYYPEVPAVGARRAGQVALFFKRLGATINVSSSKYLLLYGTSAEFPKPSLIPVVDYRIKSVSKDHFHPPGGAQGMTGYALFSKLSNSFPSTLLFGQGGLLYILNSYQFHKRQFAKTNAPKLVFTSFRTWSDVYVGYLLKRKFPDVYWWCDWRDAPFDPTLSNYGSLSRQTAVLKRVLAKADLITGVSQGVLDAIGAGGKNNAFLVRNGFIPLSLKPSPPVQLKEIDTPFVAYTGSLYGENNEPKNIFKAIAKIPKLKIVYAGKDGEVWRMFAQRYQVEDQCIILGQVEEATARWIQENALANILLTYTAPGYTGDVSMKIYEYLASGRPILCGHKGPKDSEIALLVAECKTTHLMSGTSYSNTEETRRWISDLLAQPCESLPNLSYSFQGQLQSFYDKTLRPLLSNG